MKEPLRPEQMTRADLLLLLIEERCNDRLGTYFVPSARETYLQRLNHWVLLYGAGDRSALNALVRKGYVERVPETGGYRITEDGKLRAQTLA